jgi:hypothetical protein
VVLARSLYRQATRPEVLAAIPHWVVAQVNHKRQLQVLLELLIAAVVAAVLQVDQARVLRAVVVLVATVKN